jgi:hypothetical protein
MVGPGRARSVADAGQDVVGAISLVRETEVLRSGASITTLRARTSEIKCLKSQLEAVRDDLTDGRTRP